MPLVTVWPTPKGSPIASTRSPTSTAPDGAVAAAIGSTGSFSAPTSILRMARSLRASASSTLAGYSRRSARLTVISCPPSMTWLLVTITPSALTMAPEPRLPSTCARGAPMPPKKAKNGSTCWRTTRLDEMFTTAGAARRTMGAKPSFIVATSPGTARLGAVSPALGPRGGSCAAAWSAREQAATARIGSRTARRGRRAALGGTVDMTPRMPRRTGAIKAKRPPASQGPRRRAAGSAPRSPGRSHRGRPPRRSSAPARCVPR